MGVNLRMKVAITGLVLLAGAASAQAMTVQDRVDSQMAIWGATMAHCRENSAKGDWEVDKKKFKACKKCFSGVGNWFTTDGLERGMACLEEFEPKTLESCGEMMEMKSDKDEEQMDEILEDSIDGWRSAAGKSKIDQLQACLILKQSNYWWKDCISSAGEGIDGLMTFRECARNTTISWVASRRPQALDMVELFMKGHGNTVEDGGLITELV